MSEQTQGQEWEIVRTVGTDAEAQLIEGFLHAQNIPAEIESVRFSQEPVNFGDMSKIHVRVPMEHRQEALRLLSELETDDLADEADAAEAATEGTDPDSLIEDDEG
jgi:hypothetical protein